MRLFLLGAPASGKTTLTGPLRRRIGPPVLDMDEELVRLNGGAWPDLAVKRDQTLEIMRRCSQLEHVVLAYSLLDQEGLTLLRDRDWSVVLLDLPEPGLRARAAERERREGWSNVQWLPQHLENIAWLREIGAFDAVLDSRRPVAELVGELAELSAAE